MRNVYLKALAFRGLPEWSAVRRFYEAGSTSHDGPIHAVVDGASLAVGKAQVQQYTMCSGSDAEDDPAGEGTNSYEAIMSSIRRKVSDFG